MTGRRPRPQLIDEFLPKIEEWVERSKGKIRADMAHEKLVALGFAGSERTTRRAVAAGEEGLRGWAGPGAPAVGDRAGDVAAVRLRRRPASSTGSRRCCSWPGWPGRRFRVVIALRDQTAAVGVRRPGPSRFRLLGGAPTYVLTDNEKTVTVEHVAGVPVRNPQMRGVRPALRGHGAHLRAGGPGRKGGVEATVKIAKADLVPTDTNLRPSTLVRRAGGGVRGVLEQVNARVHRVTRRAPAEMLAEERARLHPVPTIRTRSRSG